MSGRTLSIAGALVLSMFLSGCNKPDHEGVLKGMIGKMEELVAVLRSIQDEASSKAAAPKVSAIGKDLQAYKKQIDEMPKPSASEDKRLKDTYENRLKAVTQDMMKESMRIGMNPKLVTPELQASMQELSALKSK
jgi:hypothetical protein